MNKREFLGAALAAGALPAATTSAATEPACTTATGPALLTISGAIRHPNRGALDGALD